MFSPSKIPSGSFAGKLLRLPLRLIPPGSRMPIVQGPLRGKRWITGGSDHGCWLGTYERDKQAVFQRAIRAGDVLYDLGAHFGWYSMLGSFLGASQVYSFEPFPSNIAMLEAHLALNGVENCRVFPVGIGKKQGLARFEAGPSSTTGHLGETATGGIAVQVETLDGLIASGELRPPDVIKCDVEGAELDALEGARLTLEQYSPTILLATHSSALHRDCKDYLSALGYATGPVPGAAVEHEMVAWRPDRRKSPVASSSLGTECV